MSVLLQPAGKGAAHRHFEETIKSPKSLSLMTPFLDSGTVDRLSEIYTDRPVPAWGVQPRKSAAWMRIQEGDVALFAGDSRVFAGGTVTLKTHSPPLARSLWAEDEHGTWEYMYFLDEVQPLDIDQEVLNAVLRYKPKAVVRQFLVLTEEQSDRILTAFGLGSERYPTPVDETEFVEATKQSFDPEQPLDAPTRAMARKEQSYLRRSLFGSSKTFVCFLCGAELPVDLLVAAHIKKRSQATQEERLDAKNIVVSMCKLGCDDLFEKGYVSVQDHRIETASGGVGFTPTLAERLSTLSGRPVEMAEGMVGYFEWHRQHCFLGSPSWTRS